MPVRATAAEILSDIAAQITNANTSGNQITHAELADILLSILALRLVDSATDLVDAARLPTATARAAGIISSSLYTKLGGIEDNATADQTGPEIVALLQALTGGARLAFSAIDNTDDLLVDIPTLSGRTLQFTLASGANRDFTLPLADSGNVGLVELATDNESDSTSINNKAITPQGMHAGIAAYNAEDFPRSVRNVQADWNASQGFAAIQNKPGEASDTADGLLSAASHIKLQEVIEDVSLSDDGTAIVFTRFDGQNPVTISFPTGGNQGGNTPTPVTDQSYAAWSSVDNDFTAAEMQAGVGATDGTLEITTATGGGFFYFAIWHTNALTAIRSSAALHPNDNQIGSFTQSRLTIDGVNGYLYRRTLVGGQAPLTSRGINATWTVEE